MCMKSTLLPCLHKFFDDFCRRVQGNLFNKKGIEKKSGRREGVEPIEKIFTYVCFSQIHFLKENKMDENCSHFYI
jgi:hypothetical protein